MDWETAERRLGSGPDSAVLGNLQLLKRLAESSSASRSGTRRTLPLRPTPLSWPLKIVIPLALVQVAAAVAVFTFGPPKEGNVPPGLVLATMLSFALSAGVLLRAGRFDARTRPLAGFFLTVAAAAARFFLPKTELGGLLPAILHFVSAFLPECFLPYFLWHFVEDFPRLLRQGRWSGWIRGGLGSGLILGWSLFVFNAAVRWRWAGGGDLSPLTRHFLPSAGSFFWLFLFALALPAPWIGYLRSREAVPEEQRRMRFFLGGIAGGLLPLLVLVFLESALPPFKAFLDQPEVRYAASFLVYLPLLSIPISTGYAVTAQRLLSLRLILHRAARWALARSSLWLLALAPWLYLARTLWRQRELSISMLLASRSIFLLLGLSLLGAALLLFRHPLLGRLERQLLGPKVAPGTVLASFHQSLDSLRDPRELEASLEQHAADLVQAERASLLLRMPGGAAWIPASPTSSAVPLNSSVSLLTEVTPEPLSLDSRDRDSPLAWIPEEELPWIGGGEVRLVVPLVLSSGENRGLLCLGPARSGLPYSDEDRQALAALAAAAALALDRLEEPLRQREGGSPPNVADAPAGECRKCGTVAASAMGSCSCGAALEAASLPFRLAGKFQLEAILGEGGMGLVYKALDSSLERPVALKTLPRLRTDALHRLRREARSMARFVHPGLALIFGAETWQGVPVLVVEYLAGGTLDHRLQEPWPPLEAVRMAAELADALVALHGQKLLHRDIKPSNIGFTALGQPKLLDFGLVRLVEEVEIEAADLEELEAAPDAGARLTKTGHLVGTPLYLSPEALRGEAPSPAQDLWSLWLVLWETLAGRHPLAGVPLRQALERLRRGHLPDIRDLRPESPPVLADALSRALAADLRRRPASAEAVRDELTSIAELLA